MFLTLHRSGRGKLSIAGGLRRFGAGGVLLTMLIVLALSAPGEALAHSRLLSSDPPAGSVLATAPGQIALTLSEPVSLQFSSINVFDSNRGQQQVDSLQAASADGTQVRARVTQVLPPGTYTVVWRVVSAIDGHLTAGSFAFRVQGAGQGSASQAQGTPQPLAGLGDAPVEGAAEAVNPARWLLRAVMLACAALLTGGPLFTLLVLEPVTAKSGEMGAAVWREVARRYSLAGLVAAVVLLVGLAIDLAAEVSTVGQVGFGAAWGRFDIAGLLLNSTRYGFAWTMKALAAMMLVAMYEWLFLQTRRRDRTTGGTWEVSVAAASFLLLAESLSSHGAAVNADRVLGLPLPVVSDWLHMVMAATWVGGLACLGLALFPAFRKLGLSAHERRSLLGQAVPRFSRLAIASVMVLAVTGVYNLALQTTDLGSIVASSYGQLVGVKVGLFAVLIGLGAVNLLRLSPRLAARRVTSPAASSGLVDGPGETRAARTLRRNVRIELALGTLVLVCAGGLTLLPPPEGARTTYSAPAVVELATPDAPPTSQAEPATVAVKSVVAGYNVALEVAPGQASDTLTFTMTGALASAPALTDVLKVQFKVTPQDISAGTADYQGEPVAGAQPFTGTWTVRAPIFTHEDDYLLGITVQRTADPDIRAAFRVTVGQEGTFRIVAEPALDLLLVTNPSPPVVGRTALTVTLLDGDRQPIEGAVVTATAQMPATNYAIPAFALRALPSRPGVYVAEASLDRSGAWVLQFEVARPNLPRVRIEASLDVAKP